jgi:hypothetical protein
MLRSLKGKEPRRSVPQTLRDQDKEATHPSLVRLSSSAASPAAASPLSPLSLRCWRSCRTHAGVLMRTIESVRRKEEPP